MHALILQALLLAWQPALSDDAAFIAEVGVFARPPIHSSRFLVKCEAVAETLKDPQAIQEMRCRIAVLRLRQGIGIKVALAELKSLASGYGNDPAYHLEVLDGELRVGTTALNREELADHLISKFPNYADLQLFKATCRVELFDQLGAERAFTKALALDPTDALPRLGRAGCYFYLNEPELALADARECLKSMASQPREFGVAYRIIALSLLDLGKLDEALLAAQRAVELLPQGDDVSINAIWLCYANSNRHFNALRVSQEHLAAYPKSEEGLMYRALAELNVGQQAQALQTARALAFEFPDFQPVAMLLARALVANGLNAEALKAFDMAESTEHLAVLNRERWDCRLRQALLLSSIGDDKLRDSRRCRDLCVQLRAEAIDPRFQRFVDLVHACSLANSGDFKAALVLLDQASTTKPDPNELQVIRQLRELFTSNTPHLIKTGHPGVLQVPNAGYFCGRLKSLWRPQK